MTASSPRDPESALVLSHVGTAARPILATLFAVDDALGEVVRGQGPAMLKRIKLVWWRDALAALDTAKAPAEPLLRAVERDLLPRGLRGEAIAALEEPWSVLLEEERLGADDLSAYAARGEVLFGLAARLLGGEAPADLAAAGEAWALVDLARHVSDRGEGEAALAAARARPRVAKWPRPLRPLGMLATLAARDAARGALPFEPQGSPARIGTMLRVRMLGR